MVPCYHGSIASWHHGTFAPWYRVSGSSAKSVAGAAAAPRRQAEGGTPPRSSSGLEDGTAIASQQHDENQGRVDRAAAAAEAAPAGRGGEGTPGRGCPRTWLLMQHARWYVRIKL